MTLEERLTAIENKANKVREEENNRLLQAKAAIKAALAEIEKLSPRVEALLAVEQKCVNEGFEIPNNFKTNVEETEDCVSRYGCRYSVDAYSIDMLGFSELYNAGDYPRDYLVFWADCDTAFVVDGKVLLTNIRWCVGGQVEINEESLEEYDLKTVEYLKTLLLHVTKRVLEEFDAFESGFYNWVDALVS
jgi:hypothetical protein